MRRIRKASILQGFSQGNASAKAILPPRLSFAEGYDAGKEGAVSGYDKAKELAKDGYEDVKEGSKDALRQGQGTALLKVPAQLERTQGSRVFCERVAFRFQEINIGDTARKASAVSQMSAALSTGRRRIRSLCFQRTAG